MIMSLLQLAPETLDQIASYLDPGDASSLSITHSVLRNPGQRSLFADVVFPEDSRGINFLKFLLAILRRPALGKYVTSLAIDTINTYDPVDLYDPDEFREAYKKLDLVWQYLPALKHLSITPMPFVPLTFEGCTSSLLSLNTRYCSETVHRLLLRNRGLLRLSFTNDCRDINENMHVCAFPQDVLPHLRQIHADLGTCCALASTRSISHISHCSFPTLEQFFTTSAALAHSPGPLRKLNLFLTVDEHQSALLDNWKFLAPVAPHFATLTSLSIKFSMDMPGYEDVKNMCQSLPTALTSLRTLRLRRPVQAQYIVMLPRVHSADFDDELGLVLLAHKRCPSLRHVSLFHRIDWHRVEPSSWIPLARHSNLKWPARKWYEQCPMHGRLVAQHEHEFEAAETDSLVSLPQHENYEPGSDDEWLSNGLDDIDWDGVVEQALEQVLELGNEEALLPPPDSDIPQDVWQEMANDPSQPEWARQSIGPLTGGNIAALLEQIDDAHRAQC